LRCCASYPDRTPIAWWTALSVFNIAKIRQGCQKVAALIPARLPKSGNVARLGRASIHHQSQVRLVDQGRRLKRLSWLLLTHLLRRQPAQLVVNQPEQLLCRMWVALLDGAKDCCDVAHAPTAYHNPRRATSGAQKKEDAETRTVLAPTRVCFIGDGIWLLQRMRSRG
jgi:hypothetical protein